MPNKIPLLSRDREGVVDLRRSKQEFTQWTKILTPATNVGDVAALDGSTPRFVPATRNAKSSRLRKFRSRKSADGSLRSTHLSARPNPFRRRGTPQQTRCAQILVNIRPVDTIPGSADLPVPGCGYRLVSPLRLDLPLRRNTLVPRNVAPQNYVSAHRILVPGVSHSFP